MSTRFIDRLASVGMQPTFQKIRMYQLVTVRQAKYSLRFEEIRANTSCCFHIEFFFTQRSFLIEATMMKLFLRFEMSRYNFLGKWQRNVSLFVGGVPMS